jgi:hypothetical protein
VAGCSSCANPRQRCAVCPRSAASGPGQRMAATQSGVARQAIAANAHGATKAARWAFLLCPTPLSRKP